MSEVGEILWKYKLSPETTNLPARHGITEIQVFEIALRTPELDEAVLQAMDRAIPFPLLFQFTHGKHIHFAASYKRPSDADSSKWVIEASFQTEPQPVRAERPPLPVALDLAGLYAQNVRRHNPPPQRNAEALRDHVSRYASIQAKTRESQALETRLRREAQFNRKVEINAALRTLTQEIASLQAC